MSAANENEFSADERRQLEALLGKPNANAGLKKQPSFAELQETIEDSASTSFEQRPTRTRRAILIAGFVAFVAVTMLLWVRPGLWASHMPASMSFMAAAFFVTISGIWMGSRPVYQPALRPWHRWLFVGVAIAIAVGASATPLSPETSEAGLIAHLKCSAIAIALSIPLYLVCRLFDRKHFASQLFFASAAGTAAALSLRMHCPVEGWTHQLFHLGGFLLFLAAVGTLAMIRRGR